MRPARGILLVKPVETEETLPGGSIIVPAQARDRLVNGQCEVIGIGEPELCRDEDCTRSVPHTTHELDARVQPGSWVLCKPRSLVDASDDRERLYFVRHSDVVAVFAREEA